ncbi:MAG: hypothetical protein KGS72_12950 [Cyanobacteria bacterium REEB67]|nr:hypothetical protein [Cyanobacteria bacterium REEB67]
MGALGNNLTTWLAATALFVWAFDFVRARGHLALKASDLTGQKFSLLGLIAGAAILFGVSAMLGLGLLASAWPFFLGVVLSFLVSTLKFENKSRSLLLLSLTVFFDIYARTTGDAAAALESSLIIGLLSWKIIANFLNGEKAVLADVAPSALYIAGQIFVHAAYSGAGAVQARDVVNSAFISSTLVNWFQRPFRSDDAFLLKRFMLSATGGLIFLILVTKVILAPQYAPMAMLIGAGFAFSFVLDGQGFKPGTSTRLGALDLIRNLLVIGCITLLATRLYGNLGLTVVAATASISFFSQAPAIAALYVAARLLEQAFCVEHVANVTGINLLHPYVSAAQYFGFFTAGALLLLLKEGRLRFFDTMAVSVVGVVAPALVNYFLHAEASGSYLIALTVSSLLLAILGQRFFEENEANLCGSLMLVATQASAIGLFTAELLDLGNAASNPERLKVIYVLAAIVAVVMVISILKTKSTVKPVAVSGD